MKWREKRAFRALEVEGKLCIIVPKPNPRSLSPADYPADSATGSRFSAGLFATPHPSLSLSHFSFKKDQTGSRPGGLAQLHSSPDSNNAEPGLSMVPEPGFT